MHDLQPTSHNVNIHGSVFGTKHNSSISLKICISLWDHWRRITIMHCKIWFLIIFLGVSFFILILAETFHRFTICWLVLIEIKIWQFARWTPVKRRHCWLSTYHQWKLTFHLLIDHQLTVKPRIQIMSISKSFFIILDDCLYNRLNSMCSYWVCYLSIKVDHVGLNKVQIKMISNYVFWYKFSFDLKSWPMKLTYLWQFKINRAFRMRDFHFLITFSLLLDINSVPCWRYWHQHREIHVRKLWKQNPKT